MTIDGSGSGGGTYRQRTNGTYYCEGGEFCSTYTEGEGASRNEFYTCRGMGCDQQIPDLFVATGPTDGSGRPDPKTPEPEFIGGRK